MNYSFCKFSLGIFLFFTFFIFSSCLKENNQDSEQEQNLINNYIQQNPDFILQNSGFYYKSVVEGTGDTVSSTSDIVIINYKTTYLETSKLFDTSNKAEATSNLITDYTLLNTIGPLKTSLTGVYGFYSIGACTGITKMKEGGKAKMVVPGYLALGSYTPLIFDVELLKVIKNPKEFELNQITNFLANDTINKTLSDSTSTGLFLLNEVAGSGNKPVDTDSVFVNYTIKLLPYKSGLYLDLPYKVLQSSNNFKIKLGTTSLIKGFNDAIKLIEVGGKATVIVPYYYGYGINPIYNVNATSGLNQLVIPQYSTLVFNLEIVSIKKN